MGGGSVRQKLGLEKVAVSENKHLGAPRMAATGDSMISYTCMNESKQLSRYAFEEEITL